MNKRFEQVDKDHRLLAMAAARLRSEGLSQQEVAARLGKSQPEVSRLLDFAQDQHFLARAPNFLIQNVDPAELEEVERRFFVNVELRGVLRELAPKGLHLNVQVLPDGDDEFASAAAGCVARLLQRSRVVGVMWGRTIRRLVANIGEHREFFDQGGRNKAQCIPLCGDPVHLMNLGEVPNSASTLAAQLNKAINPEDPSTQPALAGVPAYLSRRRPPERGSGGSDLEAFVRGIPGYQEIFGPGKEKPWVERLDTILSGMGIIVPVPRQPAPRREGPAPAAREETGDFIRERLVQEDISPTELARLVHGDIGGWLIEKDLKAAEDRRQVESLNQGWTGVKGEHFANVARNAGPDGFPGSVLVAAGARKATMIKELARRGFVNEFLIDSTLADALKPR